MTGLLAGKTALVTGASRGLGLEIARQLAAAGAGVAMVARDAAALELALQDVRAVASDGRFRSYAGDLGQSADVDRITNEALRDFGPIDILVNNAGVQGPIGPAESCSFEAWRGVFDVNLFAAVRLSQLLIPGMRHRGGGKIVNLSGGGATGPRPDFSAYAVSKAALVRFTETLAEEVKQDHIDVNAVAPGAMNTRMMQEVIAAGPGKAQREYAATVKRSVEGGTPPQAAAELVLFLASPQSNGISGKLISAVWDDWKNLPARKVELAKSDVYTLRRIVPKDRGFAW